MMLKICLLIYKLDIGGAQRQIVALSKALAEAGHDVTLMSCYDGGVFGEDVKSHEKVKYVSLNKKGRWDMFGFLFCFLLELRKIKPDVIYGFLSLANIISVFAKILLPKVKVVFGVRASKMDMKKYGLFMRIAFQLECIFSRFADSIIANSVAGKIEYQNVFSFPYEIRVVQNGIDTELFKPDLGKRIKQRAEWKISDATTLIGIVGRIDTMKGYATFINAAAISFQKHGDICFVCVGDGPENYVLELRVLADNLGISDRIIWAGFVQDMSQVYNALDLFTSASLFGEGFSNAIGEAMATGIPCVVTDVGDSALIVGDNGIVVPPED
jgi:glycosyltransferase involved in cell wall biosynthesis